MKGYILNIDPMNNSSGPGYRVLITLDSNGELEMSSNETVDRIRKFRPYIGPEGGGVTFTGDLFSQIKYLEETCHICHKAGFTTCIITDGCGYIYNDEINLLNQIDLVILKINSLPLYNYNDYSTEKLMEINKFVNYLNEIKKPLWIKQVITKDLNDNEKYILALKKFIRMFDNIADIELLCDNVSESDMDEFKKILSEA